MKRLADGYRHAIAGAVVAIIGTWAVEELTGTSLEEALSPVVTAIHQLVAVPAVGKSGDSVARAQSLDRPGGWPRTVAEVQGLTEERVHAFSTDYVVRDFYSPFTAEGVTLPLYNNQTGEGSWIPALSRPAPTSLASLTSSGVFEAFSVFIRVAEDSTNDRRPGLQGIRGYDEVDYEVFKRLAPIWREQRVLHP